MSPHFTPDSLPDLGGCTAIVTGGYNGIGIHTSLELARHGATVYIAGRSNTTAEKAIATITKEVPRADIRFLQLDLTSLASVKNAAKEVSEKESKLHILVNSAGIMATPYELTGDGYEIQFEVNYLGHYLFTKLLLPLLEAGAAASPEGRVRIVNVSSVGHTFMAPKQGINFEDVNLKGSSVWTRYGQAKLANVLHAKQLAKIYGPRGITVVSLHPGVVKTELARGPRASVPGYRFLQPILEFRALSPREGAFTSLFCAASPEIDLKRDNGKYFVPMGKEAEPSKSARDPALAQRLWDWTEDALKR